MFSRWKRKIPFDKPTFLHDLFSSSPKSVVRLITGQGHCFWALPLLFYRKPLDTLPLFCYESGTLEIGNAIIVIKDLSVGK